MAGYEVVLSSKPERIVILATETLDLFYQLGGTAVGRASAPGTPVTEAQRAARDVGHITSVSLEQIASLQPDLVIGQAFFHENLRQSFTSSRVPFALLKITGYEDIRTVGKLFGRMLDKEAETNRLLDQMDQRVRSVIERAPHRSTSFAQVTIMPMGVYIQKDGSTTEDIARMLGMTNVAEGMIAGEWPDYVPFSLEALIRADPDYLFMITHGTQEFGKQWLQEEMETNPAWSSLRAVRENRLLFLPENFEKTPGLTIDAWFEYMARLVYPDVLGEASRHASTE